MDYGIRSGKSLSLGMPKAPQGNIQGRSKQLSLGMPPEGIPSFVSNIIGNLTWSYVFIRHMICVLLGASIYFVNICFLLFRTMFCIFYFNKSGIDSCRCQNRRISGRGSRTVRLRRMVTGDKGHDVLPRFGPSWRR